MTYGQWVLVGILNCVAFLAFSMTDFYELMTDEYESPHG